VATRGEHVLAAGADGRKPGCVVSRGSRSAAEQAVCDGLVGLQALARKKSGRLQFMPLMAKASAGGQTMAKCER